VKDTQATGTPRVWRFGDDVAPLRAAVEGGEVLAIPTESSYGLAVDPRHEGGVEAIYALKERERGKPLLVVAADLDQLAALGVDPESPAWAFGSRHWPAPLTILMPLRPGVAWPAMAGASTLACRIPAHGALRALLGQIACPLTATSANRAGAAPLTDPAAVAEWLATAPAATWIVDGGVLPGSEPSTLAAFDARGRIQILRSGAYQLG
jgi:L-threonylcarbamoyladenylate synthase